MAAFIYQCAVNPTHPTKSFPSARVIPPCCCGMHMIKVPSGTYQGSNKDSPEPQYINQQQQIRPALSSQNKPQFGLNPLFQEISKKAYQIFLERKGGAGNDLSDWVQAEKEVKKKHNLR